jgi:hypothetical protein
MLRAASRLASLPARMPLSFAVGYGGIKTVAADAMVQHLVERKPELDRSRLAVFLGFGCFQVGFVQYTLYVSIFSRAFPGAAAFAAAPLAAKLRDVRGLQNLAKQVVLDQFCYHPLCYFPVFYTCQEIVLYGFSRAPTEHVQNAITKYIPNAWADLTALWKLFIPTSIIQFAFMPMHLRVPFVATVGFVWCGILSSMRGEEIVERSRELEATSDRL